MESSTINQIIGSVTTLAGITLAYIFQKKNKKQTQETILQVEKADLASPVKQKLVLSLKKTRKKSYFNWYLFSIIILSMIVSLTLSRYLCDYHLKYVFSGIIIDSVDLQPIVNAKVFIADEEGETYSDESGKFKLPILSRQNNFFFCPSCIVETEVVNLVIQDTLASNPRTLLNVQISRPNSDMIDDTEFKTKR